MEEVKGTLEAYIRREERRRAEKGDDRRFLLTPERLSIAVRIAEALVYLHQKRLIHRDVKPANIFIPDNSAAGLRRSHAKLGDFGIMKWGDFQASISTGTLTVTSQAGLGTLKYMSPEQAIAPRDVTVRSDVYSFAITLWELFTGQIPPSPHHVFEVVNARLMRGTTPQPMLTLGYGYDLPWNDLGVAEIILDMHLRGPSGRPPIEKIARRLAAELERRTSE